MAGPNDDIKLLAAVAAASSMLQVAFLRGLMAIGGGNELLLGVLLSGFLAWIAAGARLFKWWKRPRRPLVLLVIFTAAALAEVSILRGIGVPLSWTAGLFGITWVAGEAVPMRIAMAAAFFIGAPTGLVSGMLFPLIVSRIRDERGAVGRVYAADALGHVAGFLGVTAALWLGASDVSVIVFIPVVALAGLPMPGKFHAISAAIVSAALLLFIPRLEEATRSRGGLLPEHPFAVESSPVREVALVGTSQEFTVYSDGHASASYPPKGLYPGIKLGILTAAQRDSALLLSEDFGVPGIVSDFGFRDVTVTAPDRTVLNLARRAVEEDGAALLPPGTSVVTGDPLRAVYGMQPKSVSFAFADLPDPLSISSNRYYTVEFQKALARALAPGGIAVESFPLASGQEEGVAEPLIMQVYSTIRAAFPDVLAFRGDGEIVFLLSPEAGNLAERMEEAALAAVRDARPGIKIAGMWANLPRHNELRSLLEDSRELPPDTLRRPTTFLKRLRVEHAFDAPTRYKSGRRSSSPLLWTILGAVLFAALGLGVLGAVKSRPRLLISLDAFSTGVLSMGAEVVLLFAYQARRGMLYLFAAAVVAAFMGGFQVGASAASRRERKSMPAGYRTSTWLPVIAAALAAAYVLVLPGIPVITEAFLLLIMLSMGYACGYNLSLLPAVDPGERASAAAVVDAVDNLGGAAGAVGVAIILVPLVGLSLSIAYLFGLKLITTLALGAAKKR